MKGKKMALIKHIDKRYISCGYINKSASGNNLVGFFRNKPMWLFFKNNHYEENMKLEFPNKYFKSKHNVPKFSIFKNKKKAFVFLPRENEKGIPYLFGKYKNRSK